MTNGSTSYHTALYLVVATVSMYLPLLMSKMEATCTVLRLIFEIPTQCKMQENERSKKKKKECCVGQKKVAKLLSTYMLSAVLWAVFQIEHATNVPHSLGMFTFRCSFFLL